MEFANHFVQICLLDEDLIMIQGNNIQCLRENVSRSSSGSQISILGWVRFFWRKLFSRKNGVGRKSVLITQLYNKRRPFSWRVVYGPCKEIVSAHTQMELVTSLEMATLCSDDNYTSLFDHFVLYCKIMKLFCLFLATLSVNKEYSKLMHLPYFITCSEISRMLKLRGFICKLHITNVDNYLKKYLRKCLNFKGLFDKYR